METRDGRAGAAAEPGPAAASRLSAADVAKVAAQARLRLTEEELEKLSGQLSDILRMAAELKALDTEGVEPTAHGLPIYNVLRDDVPQRSMPREDVLAGAPEQQDGYFKVPRILEEA